MSLEEVSPDHSTISRFRTQLSKSGGYDEVFHALNRQLEACGIIVKTGAIVDTPLKTEGKPSYEVVEDHAKPSSSEVTPSLDKVIPPSVDQQAS